MNRIERIGIILLLGAAAGVLLKIILDVVYLVEVWK